MSVTDPVRLGRRAVAPPRAWRSLSLLLLRYGMVLVLVAMIVVTSILDSSFLESSNLLNLLLEWAPQGLMAIGMTYVIITGGFDLSVGGIFAGASVLAAAVASHAAIALAILAAVAAGAGVGLINGGLITTLEVNPFVATLGMGFVVTGVAEVASKATPILVTKESFAAIGNGKWLTIPIPGCLLIIGLLIGGYLLARTVYGRFIYAVGGSEEASRLSGVRTRLVRTGAYTLSGALAGLAGIIIASRLSEGQANVGQNVELQVITIVVVGGTALTGGEGAMWRTAVGIAILAVLGNAFNRLQVSAFYQEIIEGAVIIGAIAIDSFGKRRLAATALGPRPRAPDLGAPADSPDTVRLAATPGKAGT
ncbi:MAG: ABC transporter permease [Solirubrobacteraceae bacterium]